MQKRTHSCWQQTALTSSSRYPHLRWLLQHRLDPLQRRRAFHRFPRLGLARLRLMKKTAQQQHLRQQAAAAKRLRMMMHDEEWVGLRRRMGELQKAQWAARVVALLQQRRHRQRLQALGTRPMVRCLLPFHWRPTSRCFLFHRLQLLWKPSRSRCELLLARPQQQQAPRQVSRLLKGALRGPPPHRPRLLSTCAT